MDVADTREEIETTRNLGTRKKQQWRTRRMGEIMDARNEGVGKYQE